MRQPKNPSHPGEILLEEFIKPAATTQAVPAKRLGWTRALGTSAKLWMNLQATFDLDRAVRRRHGVA